MDKIENKLTEIGVHNEETVAPLPLFNKSDSFVAHDHKVVLVQNVQTVIKVDSNDKHKYKYRNTKRTFGINICM